MAYKVIIETPKGSYKKYEIKKGKLVLDQVLSPEFSFPGNYGFFPETLTGDGDALDVLVLSTKPVKKKAEIKIKVIGIMHMIDNGKQDDKIIAIRAHSRERKLKKSEKEQIRYFFKHYKQRKIKIKGFGGIEKAKKAILQAKKRYKNVL
ncbi:inorganic pyrophosphatase [Candidatus Woesearchaeota archaeon]|nr:inorganic pyrophosphatase [Candidatus Woesearchaeota archaeon]